MSEYHAAVGLAELDGWTSKIEKLRAVADAYRACFSERSLAERIVAAPSVASCYILFEARDSSEAEAVCANLVREGIEYRLWYGGGLHREPYFASASREDLPVTDAIAGRIIGLPTAPDLPREVVDRVAATVASAIE